MEGGHAHSLAEAGQHRSGPVVWASIIASTCLLLFFFQKILWLVVPFLLALILYYFLYPAMQALIYRGMSREAAAGSVTLGFLVLLSVIGVAVTPWVAGHASGWQESLVRYLQGGMQLLDRSLRGLESHWPTLANARLADTVATRLTESTGSLTDHIEPVAMGIMAWTPSLLLAPFLAFFFLRDGRRFQRFLGGAVPNAFFEKTLYLMHEVDRTSRAYFQGLIKLTVLDTLTLALGLWVLGIPGPFALGLICAVLAWIPYVGSIVGGLLVVLVAATDFPDAPGMAYWAIALFALVRLLDDFVYMPLTVGKSLALHPLVTVLMIFVGGAVAGVAGLMLVLPVLGVVMVVGETIGVVVTDPRLMARHRHARA
ncbi:MAG TPA: AI-2E family transporter, partial [Rhodocyclaceae bacterium]|nr:AI-2E family transporter [Rhodocyclaceae bacterium]